MPTHVDNLHYMRILFLGAGAVGGYFGGKIAKLLLSEDEKADNDVTFLVRSARAEQLRRDGLRIEDPAGQVTTIMPINTVTSESIDGETGDRPTTFDVIVLACKSYGLDGALDAITPFVHPGVKILPLLNGMAHLEVIDERFPEAVIWGGTCGIVATLMPDGSVKKMTDSQFVTAGVRSKSNTCAVTSDSVLVSLIELMRKAGIEANLSDNILEKMWEKWTFLATLAAATCLLDGSIGEILATGDSGRHYIQGVFLECNAIAAAEGGITPSEDESLQRQRQQIYTRVLGDTKSITRASMARDMATGNPTEVDHILGDLIRRAEKHGIDTSLLSIAYARLQVYEHQRNKKLTAQTGKLGNT